MKRVVRYMLVATAIAMAYAAWVMIARYLENRRLEESDQRRRAVVMQALPPGLSGSEVKILQFYTVPAELRQGEKGQICYSVLNAKSVRIEPGVERLWPSLNRCFDVAPRTTTRYTLTAEGQDGRLVSESFVLRLAR